MKNKKMINIISLIISFVVLLSFSLNLKLSKEVFGNNFIKNNLYINMIVFFALYYFIKNSFNKNIKSSFSSIFVATIISLTQLLSYPYKEKLPLNILYCNPIQLIKSIIYLCGNFFLLNLIIAFIYHKIENIKKEKVFNKLNENFILNFIFEKHPFITTTIILLIFYIPIIYIFYPGVHNADFIDEMYQFYHQKTWSLNYINLINDNVYINGHHSPFHTIIIGLLNNLGCHLSGPNLGLFLNVLFQLIFQLLVLSYSICLLKKLRVPMIIRIIVMLLYIFSPFYLFGHVNLYKDIPFSLSILLYVCLLIDYVYLDNRNIKTIFLLIVSALLVTLFSKKGIYCLYITFIPIIFTYKVKAWKTILVFLTPILLFQVYDKIILPYYDVTPGSVQEMLSLPIQQVSLVIKNHPDEIKEKEKNTISALLPYDEIPELYNGETADPIKNRFNKDYTNKQVIKFIKVWSKLLVKYPREYVEAFINLYYNNLYIEKTSSPSYFEFKNNNENKFSEISYTRDKKHEQLLSKTKEILLSFQKIPIYNLLLSLPLYNWVFVIYFVYMLKKHRNKNIIPILPVLVTFLLLFISPVSGNRRYEMPIIFCLPIIMTYIFAIEYNKKENKSKTKITN